MYLRGCSPTPTSPSHHSSTVVIDYDTVFPDGVPDHSPGPYQRLPYPPHVVLLKAYTGSGGYRDWEFSLLQWFQRRAGLDTLLATFNQPDLYIDPVATLLRAPDIRGVEEVHPEFRLSTYLIYMYRCIRTM